MPKAWTLVINDEMHEQLRAHLFQPDRDEHGAVIAAGVATSRRGTRLLARELHIARDGIDFVPSPVGHRMLTSEFVNGMIRHCRDERLAFLAVHNHGGTNSVEFSPIDNASHERGYPALLDIARGQPVGALVLARNALAGDIWTSDRRRRSIKETIVVGANLSRVFPEPPALPKGADPSYDRQVRVLGERGQALLGRIKVGVVGAGGVGVVLVSQLARLGVGELVVIDPDRIDPTNLPRLPESRRSDAMTFLRRLALLEPLAKRLSTRKVRLARRIARRANRRGRFRGLAIDVIEPEAAKELSDCDFVFLAADSHRARRLVNAVAYQYMVPAYDLGTRVEVDEGSGVVGEIRSNLRLVLPERGCMRCNKLISGSKLQEELLSPAERERNRYVDEIPAPSVITFNTLAASQATTDFLLMTVELMQPASHTDHLLFRPRRRRHEQVVALPNLDACRDCGTLPTSRRARGDGDELPLPQRKPRRGLQLLRRRARAHSRPTA
jgi:hypothetical protein